MIYKTGSKNILFVVISYYQVYKDILFIKLILYLVISFKDPRRRPSYNILLLFFDSSISSISWLFIDLSRLGSNVAGLM